MSFAQLDMPQLDLDRPQCLILNRLMLADALPLLRQYLRQQADDGQTHVPVRPEARELLPRLASRRQAEADAARLSRTAPGPSSQPPAAAPPSPDPGSASAVPSLVLEVAGATREEKLARLAQMAEEAPAPRALGTLRGTMVFAVGNPNAGVMFIGEAPGAEEERQHEPFVGPAGQLLTKIITAMGLKRADVYISNICKFRPAMENQGNGNRKPSAQEMAACLPFILTEIDIIRPKVIVALGGTAAEGLGIPGPVGRNRGRFHVVGGVPVVVTWHPSYLLRQEQEGAGLQAKRQSWEDMLMAMDEAGLPISEKQRGFFKSRAG